MSKEKSDTRQWYLRIVGKTIFGPVSTPGLILWAEQGRILPGHEVSTDRETWQPAEQVPELGINWYIDDGAENLRGPFNRTAADVILKSGKAPADTRLVPAAEVDLSRVIRPGVEPRLAEPSPREPSHKSRTDAKSEEKSHSESDALRQQIAALEADFAKQKEVLAQARHAAKQCVELEHERDALRLSLEQAEHACAVAVAQTALLQSQLVESQAAFNDVLSFSNNRENELQTQIEELQRPRSPVERATEACAADPGGVLAHILGQEIECIEKDLSLERDALSRLRDWSTQRQEALQTRIHELRRMVHGGVGGVSAGEKTRDGSSRFRTPDALRLQAEMDTLRATHAEAMRAVEDRVTELKRKIRDAEAEDSRLRAQVAEADKLTQTNQELVEVARRRDLELNQERKHRDVERENYAAAQQTLLRRIEQLERATDESVTKSALAPAKDLLRESTTAPRRSNLAPWFRLKR